MIKTRFVLGGTGNLELTREPVANNTAELYPKENIVGVIPITVNKKQARAEIKYNTLVGNFKIGETVTGTTSGATGVVYGFKGGFTLLLADIVPGTSDFVAGETITGGTSLATAVVVSNTPLSFDNEWIYPYDVMTIIEITFVDRTRLNIELQDISNQATWSTGTLGGQQAAIAAINAWL